MRIGELAHQTGVVAKTIRYYEQIGLLHEPERTNSGYRDYDHSAAARLVFIRAARAVDLSLGEIREILAIRDRGETPCSHVAWVIERHADGLAERIAVLERMRADLTRLVSRARRMSPAEAVGAQFCHIIETIAPPTHVGRRESAHEMDGATIGPARPVEG